MKTLFKHLLLAAMVMGFCAFNPMTSTPCDHIHDETCGYETTTDTGCTHIHEDQPTTLESDLGPLG